MPPLHTQTDRQIFGLQQQIRQHEAWLDGDRHDRRAVNFHKAKLAELRAELTKLMETNQ
jgi:hypothetical protein